MLYFIIALIIALADRLVKYETTLRIALGEQMELIPGILRISHSRNTGAAFSFMSGYTWILTAVSAAAIIVIIIAKVRLRVLGRLSLAFILGGAIGNLIDRLVFGYVVDMFEVEFLHFGSFEFPVFNVADAFITIGGILLVIYLIFIAGRGTKPAAEQPQQHRLPTDEEIAERLSAELGIPSDLAHLDPEEFDVPGSGDDENA